MLYGNATLTGKERFFNEGEVIVSKTDPTGKMTYVNRVFLNISGYTEAECLGVQHNMIRHPHMPRAVFDLLWNNLQAKREVFAYINNRSKNGDNYWVLAHVTPSLNAQGDIIGYHSNRRVPDRDILTTHIMPLYDKILKAEQACASPKDGLKAGGDIIHAVLAEKNMEFNEFTFSLNKA